MASRASQTEDAIIVVSGETLEAALAAGNQLVREDDRWTLEGGIVIDPRPAKHSQRYLLTFIRDTFEYDDNFYDEDEDFVTDEETTDG